MIEVFENESLIKKVTIEYVDGSKETFEDEFLMVVTDKGDMGKWNVKFSEQADLENVLSFAYDAVDEIENATMNETINAKKISHLRLVKG